MLMLCGVLCDASTGHATCNLAPWTIGVGGHNWVPGVPHFDDVAPAALAALNGDVDALAALPTEALNGKFGRHDFDALWFAAYVCSAPVAIHLLGRADAPWHDARYPHDLLVEHAERRNCTRVAELLRAGLQGHGK